MEISYNDLYKIIKEQNFLEWKELADFISNKYSIEILSMETLKRFFRSFKEKWTNAQRKTTRFEQNNGLWLNATIKLETKEKKSSTSSQPSTSKGRPKKSLEECSEVTKRRRLKEHNENLTTDSIKQSLCQRYKSDNLHQKALIVEAVNKASPIREKRIKESIITPKGQPQKFTPEEALSLFLDLGLSKEKYTVLRSELKKRNHDALPSYKKISTAKKECIPECEVTNSSASTALQSLLDCTSKRILQMKTKDEIEALSGNSFELLSKWGCDGSSGQSEYKQIITEDGTQIVTDANMFMTSLVPLRLKFLNSENLLWKNPRPSSPHFCRPIKFQYQKETKELIQSEVENIRNQINSLVPTKCSIFGKEITVNHTLYLTMLDGKAVQHVTETKSSSTCIICQKNPKDFENVEESNDVVENYQYGLSPLHARIRFMEYILHLSYDLSFAGKSVRNNAENKQKREDEKLRIQTEFKNELGLIVDKPKHGFGSSNDGNTARRFFENPEITAQITRVDVNLIKNFKIILNVLSSGFAINAERFGIFAQNTEKLIHEKYPWRNLTPTVHKVLKHGKRIILHHMLPIGEMSEEAQEAKNKDYKHFRFHNTKKISREDQNRDLMNILLLSSDPYISSFRNVRRKKDIMKIYSEEMTQLLDIVQEDYNIFSPILN